MSSNSVAENRLGKHRVLLVDDHPLVRRGLAELIREEADMDVVGEAEDADGAMRLLESTHPDVVVLDVSLRNSNGIELIERIKGRDESVRMLVSSMHDEMLFAERALRAGAMGYINKQEPLERVLDAIRQILDGDVYLSARMANRLLQAAVGGEPMDQDPIQTLSNRELEVFQLIGQGFTTRQIAEKLHLSPKTIETHREKIKAKLNLANSVELARHAVQWVLQGC
jgi:DNA-binding NarL/FixJ family response regulator